MNSSDRIVNALTEAGVSVPGYGRIELIIQDGRVMDITKVDKVRLV